MQKRSKRILAAALAAAGVLAAAGTAWAIFSAQSTATADARSGQLVGLTVGDGVSQNAPRVIFANGEPGLYPNRDLNGVEDGNAHMAPTRRPSRSRSPTATRAVVVSTVEAGRSRSTICPFNGDNAARNYCNALIDTSTIALANGPVVHAGETKTLTVTGIYLDATADNRCKDKPFSTSWTVNADAL